MSDGLLDSLRVLDLTVWRPGPYATQLLAELGADVLKVEPPGGDPMRAYPDLFTSLNVNKRGLVLDLKDDADHRRLLDLAADADLIVEGFRPGVAERLGVGFEAVRGVNPSIIYCSVSGMGQTGPLAHTPGHDIVYQAWAGVLAPDGGPPVVPRVPIADLAGGMAAALAVCAAVVRRLRTGEGERIDLAMTDVLATWTGAFRPQAEGVDAGDGVPGYGVFATADGGYVALGALTEDRFWASLCDVLGLGDLRELTFEERMSDVVRLQAQIAEAIGSHRRDDLVAAFLDADVPAAPVLDRVGMLGLEHFATRSVVTSDPWASIAVGHPVRFEEHPARRVSAAPALDEHRGQGFWRGER